MPEIQCLCHRGIKIPPARLLQITFGLVYTVHEASLYTSRITIYTHTYIYTITDVWFTRTRINRSMRRNCWDQTNLRTANENWASHFHRVLVFNKKNSIYHRGSTIGFFRFISLDGQLHANSTRTINQPVKQMVLNETSSSQSWQVHFYQNHGPWNCPLYPCNYPVNVVLFFFLSLPKARAIRFTGSFRYALLLFLSHFLSLVFTSLMQRTDRFHLSRNFRIAYSPQEMSFSVDYC